MVVNLSSRVGVARQVHHLGWVWSGLGWEYSQSCASPGVGVVRTGLSSRVGVVRVGLSSRVGWCITQGGCGQGWSTLKMSIPPIR